MLSHRPRLVLHIGTHKTGTSAIQSALARSRLLLRAAGVLYPRTDREPWPQLPKHCSVWRASVSDDAAAAQAERQLVMDEFRASGAHTLVLSEEGFSEPLPRIAAWFAGWQDEFDIHIICLLRRQDLFAESLFNQFVREPARREARPLATFVQAPAVRERLHYAQWLGHWRHHLPQAELSLLDFDAAARSPGVVQAFTQLARLGPLQLSDVVANPSPDMRLALALNRLNRLALDYELPRLLEAAHHLSQSRRFPRCRHLLGRDARQRLIDSYAEGNAQLAQAYGLHFATELPDTEAAAATEQLEEAYLLELMAQLSKSRSSA